jgi:hypothetical protein
MATKNRQQAFPRAGFGFAYRDEGFESEPAQDGMELRDYFAARALQGMLSGSLNAEKTVGDKQQLARVVYEFADAMMAVR